MSTTARELLLLPVVMVVAIGALASCAPVEAPGTSGSSGSEAEEEIDPITCVIGNWTISEAEMQRYYDQVSSGVDGTTFTVNGTTGLVFGDTDYAYLPSFSLDLDVSGSPATATIHGSITGDYVVDGGEITTNNDDNIISMIVDVGGFTMDGTELAQEMLSANPVSSAPYECRPGPELIISMETGYGRVPITLVPTD